MSAMPDTTIALAQALAGVPCARIATPMGMVSYREGRSSGHVGPLTHVLLHGIGSGSGSWLAQLAAATDATGPGCHVVAWDAPGYGESAALPMEAPSAADYAQRLWTWLDALQPDGGAPLTLVGHSLGALMAASAATLRPTGVRQMILLAPAQGYAKADAELREKKLSDRLANLDRLGPAGMARERSAAMLSVNANAEQVQFVAQIMAAIHPQGYRQAARMLAGGDITADLARLRCPVVIASGSADTITPQAGCRALAAQVGARYLSLGDVGHSCALEAARSVNALLEIGGVLQ